MSFVVDMQLPLDHIAFVGYTALFVFALIKAGNFMNNVTGLLSTVFLLMGLGSLMTYHARKIMTKKDETNDVIQKNVRLMAHACLVLFLILTLSPVTKSKFQFYDTFALFAHMILFATVLANMNQVGGVGLLAFYFAFAAFYGMRFTGLDSIQFIGRILLLVFFVVSFVSMIAPRA
jgi:preprotein translocase subunit SecG